MANSLLVLFGSPDDDRAMTGAMLVAHGLDDLNICAEFARAYAEMLSRRR
jgi:hypothetical protein